MCSFVNSICIKILNVLNCWNLLIWYVREPSVDDNCDQEFIITTIPATVAYSFLTAAVYLNKSYPKQVNLHIHVVIIIDYYFILPCLLINSEVWLCFSTEIQTTGCIINFTTAACWRDCRYSTEILFTAAQVLILRFGFTKCHSDSLFKYISIHASKLGYYWVMDGMVLSFML